MYNRDQPEPIYHELVIEQTELDMLMDLLREARSTGYHETGSADEAVNISVMNKLYATRQMPLVDSPTGLVGDPLNDNYFDTHTLVS